MQYIYRLHFKYDTTLVPGGHIDIYSKPFASDTIPNRLVSEIMSKENGRIGVYLYALEELLSDGEWRVV